MGRHPHRVRLSHLAHLAAWLVILAVALQCPPPACTAVQFDAAASIQLVKSGRPARLKESQDSDVDRDAPRSRVRTFKGAKVPAGGYDPQRIKGFWRSYHGARQRPKQKPLEHERSFGPGRHN
jgi:hypothetical protein